MLIGRIIHFRSGRMCDATESSDFVCINETNSETNSLFCLESWKLESVIGMQVKSTSGKINKMPTCFKNLESCSFVVEEKPKHAFVLMPFKEEMDVIYADGIKETLLELGWACGRADEKFDTPEIICTICKNIQEASLIIADLTGKNENVFLEVGLAFGLGKHVAFLSQNTDDIPFDAKTFRTILYDAKDINKLRKNLQSLIKTVQSFPKSLNPSGFARKCAGRTKIQGIPSEPLMEIFIGSEVPISEWLLPTTQDSEIANAIPDAFNVQSVVPRRGYFEFKTRSQPFFARLDTNGFFQAVVPLRHNSGIYVSLIVQEIAEALFFMVRVLKGKEKTEKQVLKIDFYGIRDLKVSLYHHFVYRGENSFSAEQDSVSYLKSFDPQDDWPSFLSLIGEIYKEIFADLGLAVAGEDTIKTAIKSNVMQTIRDMDSLRREYRTARLPSLDISQILLNWIAITRESR